MSTSNLKNAVDFFNAIWQVTDSVTTTGGDYSNSFFCEPPKYDNWYYRVEIPTNVHIYDDKYPPMNLWVNDETLDLVMEFAVAGIPRESLSVDFEDGSMILEIESQESEREGYTLSQKGIRTRKSKTRYNVPFTKYDVDNAKATLDNGILTVNIPARDEIKPKKLMIE